MKKILIVNQGFSNNLGDKLISRSMSFYFKNKGYIVRNAGFTWFQEVKIENIDYRRYKAERKYDLPIKVKWVLKKKRYVQKNIEKYIDYYDFLIIGGGQLIKTNCYFPYAMREWVEFGKKYAKKIILLGVGADEKFSFIEKRIYAYNFAQCDSIVVRDTYSKKVLKKLFNVDSIVLPDMAFLSSRWLKSRNIEEINPVVMPFDFGTYSIHFKNKENYLSYQEKWKKIIDKELLINKKVILCYTTPEDKRECYNLTAYLGKTYENSVKIEKTDDLGQLIDCISKASIVYTSRMHAMIISMMLNKTVESLCISKKTEQFRDEYLESLDSIGTLCEKIEFNVNNILGKEGA